jgi:hypothetical protein|tara:strand:- start:84 stop:419 length:336 start_codon:yes stop_codon:yes gene_type:complete
MSRYFGRNKRLNKNPLYQEFLDKRNVKQIEQYTSPVFPELTPARRASIEYDTHVWKRGDKFYKLAYQYYGDSELWWLIAWFNQSPTESHLRLGDRIMVPTFYERVMTYFNR